MNITLCEIKQVKTLAKQLEINYPNLKLAHRLDKAAVQFLGVRNYHEVRRLYEKWLMLEVHPVEDASGVSKCSYCNFSFVSSLKDDRNSHRKQHEQFHEACVFLSYRPGNYVQRELMKSDGREQAVNGVTLENRFDGLLLLLRGWFDRSLVDAIYGGYWRKHPSFDHYASMIQDTLGNSYSELTPLLKERFGCRSGHIEPGNSYWYPKNR